MGIVHKLFCAHKQQQGLGVPAIIIFNHVRFIFLLDFDNIVVAWCMTHIHVFLLNFQPSNMALG